MPYIESNGISIYCETHGKGENLVLVSGLGSDHTFWNASIETLARHYRVIVFDARGIGKTDAPHEPYHMSQLADDLAGLMDALQIERAHILGHSMGGCVAQMFALRHPARIIKLVLAATFAVNNIQTRLFLDGILSIYELGTTPKQVYALLMPWLYSPTFLGDPGNAAYFVYDENAPNQQPFYAWKNQYLAIREFNAAALLTNINADTLIIAGEKDRIAHVSDSELLNNKITGSQMAVINDAGHLLNYEQPASFHSHVLSFLS